MSTDQQTGIDDLDSAPRRLGPVASMTLANVTLPDGTTTRLHVSEGLIVDRAPDGATEIDCTGLIALPGLVDLHTHLREPGREDAETIATGTAAAARGGYTAVFAMANTNPVTDSVERVEDLYDRSRAALAEVVPIGSLTIGLQGTELTDLAALHTSRAHTQVFSDDGKCLMNAALMRQALETVAGFGGVVAQHAQDENLAGASSCCHEGAVSEQLGLPGWPAEAESVIIARDVELARRSGGRLHICHVSTAEGVEVLRWAKSRGIAVTAEVTPHHLLLTHEMLHRQDTTWKVNPPLRSHEDVEAVRTALAEKVIDIVGTDHAPHHHSDKDLPFHEAKPGMTALEQALAVVIETMVLTGRLDWAGVADRMSITPAQIGGLATQGQPLVPGSPANIVLVNPKPRAVVNPEDSHSLGRNNPYRDLDLPDPVAATWWAGRQTFTRLPCPATVQ